MDALVENDAVKRAYDNWNSQNDGAASRLAGDVRCGFVYAGIEFIEDADGNRYTYDINGTTNYSGVLGKKIGIDGMREVAKWIKREVARTFMTLPARRAS